MGKNGKRRWLGWSATGIFVTIGLVAIFGSGFSGCATFSIERDEAKRRFLDRGLEPPEFIGIELGEKTLHLVSVGEGELTVVFVHGSPGSWNDYRRYLMNPKLKELGRLISIDRPGFGDSRPLRAEPSLEEQARQISAALERLGVSENAILVGHSLGGPVVARLAADYPRLARGQILVAPSMDPELEKRRWYNYAAKFPPVKWSISKAWGNSNDEIFPHKGELIELAPLLPGIATPTTVIQGLEDELVPPGNADYVERTMTGVQSMSVRRIEGLNHFVPWRRADLIEDAILELAEK